MLEEVAIKATKDRVELINATIEEEKTKAVAEAKLKGIEEYKASWEFKLKVTDGSLVAYVYGFKTYKR